MTPAQAAKILGCDVGATEDDVKWAFAAGVKLNHPDSIAGQQKGSDCVPMATLKQARDVLLKREATCPYCRGTGWQSVGMRKQRCVRGCALPA